jgi:hypothetical protein
MAFVISMPRDFKVGETRDCRINREPAQVTWRDADTLVIEPGDAREVVFIDRGPDLLTFICADADGTRPSVVAEIGTNG